MPGRSGSDERPTEKEAMTIRTILVDDEPLAYPGADATAAGA
jgi:hypothetical protein